MIFSALLIITLSFANVDARLNDATSKKNSIVFRTSAGLDDITDEEVIHFKSSYSLLDEVNLQFQEITASKTLNYKEKEYSVGEINKPANIFTDGATYRHDGIPGECPKSNIYQEETSEEIITVVKNLQEDIESVTIINKENNEIAELSTISPGIFTTVQENYYNYDDINAKFIFEEKSDESLERRLSNITDKQRQTSSATCSSYKNLELAIAYESSFCREQGGRDKADQKVMSVIADVANKYKQQNLCVQLQISHLEGYCDSKSDPYKEAVDKKISGCGAGYGLLDDVTGYWEQNRRDVHRDAMHLFSGTGFECQGGCLIGCASTMAICSSNAYGVNHVTYHSSRNLQAVLVAHELGHTCGASHYNDEKGYIMNAGIGSASKGFSTESLNVINYVFSRTSCITEATAPTPQPIPSSPTSSPLKDNESLKQLAVQVSFEMKGITPAQSPTNQHNMKSVIETALENTLDDVQIKDLSFEQNAVKIVSFKVYVNVICVGDCAAMTTDEIAIIKQEIGNESFISQIRNTAEEYEVSHLFNNAKVDISTFAYQDPLLSKVTTAPTPVPANPRPVPVIPIFEDNVQERPCRNASLQEIVKVAKSLFAS